MNQNETRTFFISVGLALFAMFMFYSYSQSKKAEYDKIHGTYKTVVVAKADINEMQTIDESMLDTVRVPETFVQPGAITDPEMVVGQVAAAPIKEKEQLLKTKILSPGPLTGVSLQVSPEMRAVSVPVDDTRGVNRLIKPGDRIDLVAAVDSGRGTDQRREVRTVLQDVVVLATGVKIVNQIPRATESSTSEGETIINLNTDVAYNNLIIEVTPRDAQDLIYIMSINSGGIFALLRNPNDRVKKDLPVSTVDSVLKRMAPMSNPAMMPLPSGVVPLSGSAPRLPSGGPAN